MSSNNNDVNETTEKFKMFKSNNYKSLKGIVRIMLMPSFSPTFKSGKITKWYGREGDFLKANDVLFDVVTHSLTNSEKAETHLHVEIQEDMYIAKLIESEGETREVQVGAPIAILCEESSDVGIAGKLSFMNEIKIVEDCSSKVQICMWQAYVKSKNDPGACGCS